MTTHLLKKITAFLSGLIIVLLLIAVVFATPAVAFAADGDDAAVYENYSSVLDDLKKDPSFDESIYPAVPSKGDLVIIQIAEGVNKELFVYVYQPAGNRVKASSINISISTGDDLNFIHYGLKLISKNGTLFKYKVEDFVVKDYKTRNYVITSIYRPFDSRFDEEPDADQTINEVPFDVSRQYEFGTDDDGTEYVACVDIETIEITDKFVGYVRYKDGFSLFSEGACDSHFVAFSTNKRIDDLLEADVYYVKQDYYRSESSTVFGTIVTPDSGFKERIEDYAYLKYTQKTSYKGRGIGGATYSWNRIESVEDFINNVEDLKTIYHGAIIGVSVGNKLTDEAKEALQEQTWVLRFLETPYNYTYSSGWGSSSSTMSQTIVGEVTILRLKFETDGIVYNLGVIDNIQTGSKDPATTPTTEVDVVIDDNIEQIGETFTNFWNDVKNWFKDHKQGFIIAAIAILVIILVVLIIVVAVKLAPYRAAHKANKQIKRSAKAERSKK